jgi:hypothetical protein
MDLQLLLNSTAFVVVMVKFAPKWLSHKAWWKLLGFVTVVVAANLLLMVDRFGFANALYRSALIALGFLVGAAVMAYVTRPKPSR